MALAIFGGAKNPTEFLRNELLIDLRRIQDNNTFIAI